MSRGRRPHCGWRHDMFNFCGEVVSRPPIRMLGVYLMDSRPSRMNNSTGSGRPGTTRIGGIGRCFESEEQCTLHWDTMDGDRSPKWKDRVGLWGKWRDELACSPVLAFDDSKDFHQLLVLIIFSRALLSGQRGWPRSPGVTTKRQNQGWQHCSDDTRGYQKKRTSALVRLQEIHEFLMLTLPRSWCRYIGLSALHLWKLRYFISDDTIYT